MIALTRPVRRETATSYRGRPLIVEPHQGSLALREKGTRRAVTVDYPDCPRGWLQDACAPGTGREGQGTDHEGHRGVINGPRPWA